MVFSTIPTPAFEVLNFGPLSIHAYGVVIATAVVSGIWLAKKRWIARSGMGDDITTIAIWSIPAGIVGARVYHVLSDWELYRYEPLNALAVWDGGLGIWGAIGGGMIAGLIAAKKRGLPLLTLLDVAAPALVLGQAIGRMGNYFNQELFGKPTSLPWGLEIDLLHRPLGFEQFSTFHPTFLYEMLWSLLLCGSLLLIDRVGRLKNGQLFLVYIAGYTAARFFIESLRIEYAHVIFGLRLNQWTSLILLIIAIGLFIYLAKNARDKSLEEAESHRTLSF